MADFEGVEEKVLGLQNVYGHFGEVVAREVQGLESRVTGFVQIPLDLAIWGLVEFVHKNWSLYLEHHHFGPVEDPSWHLGEVVLRQIQQQSDGAQKGVRFKLRDSVFA